MYSVRMIDGIILVLALEMTSLAIYRTARGSGLRAPELVSFLGAGLSMLVALRVLASGGPFIAFAASMLLSLLLHIWHVRQRWQH